MLITANQITKFHNDKCIFKDISFSIEEQEKIAVIGVNGTGKSTLLKILAGMETYDGAPLLKRRDLRISYLPQNPAFHDALSILEQMHESIQDDKVEDFEIKSVLGKLKIYDVNEKIGHLSGGQKKRVALALALLKPSDLLILDEPTNHLDNEMIEWLEKFLIKFNKSVVMVTHDRYFLDRITNVIYEIDRTSLFKYEANYSTFLELKAEREEIELNKERKRNAFLKKELEWVRAGVQARGTKSKGRLDRYEALRSIEKIKEKENVEMIHVESRLGRKTIEWENLGMQYGDKVLFSDFSYNMKRNDRIGVIGSNGTGKSTLLNILAKQLQPTSGTIVYGETVRIGYFKQDCEVMDEEMRVIDYIRDVSDNLSTSEGNFSAKMMLERFLFDSNLQYSKIGMLSGGEKRRLYLLKVLMEGPNILFFDEPTNDLDIETLTILEDYLDSFNGALITVSHDRYFLDRICDALFVFENDNVHLHVGGYSAYIDTCQKEVKVKSDGASLYALQKQKQKENALFMSSKEKKELAQMEDVILALEEAIANVDEEMNVCVDDFVKIESLSKKRDTLHNELEEKNERWMYLLEKEEQIKALKK